MRTCTVALSHLWRKKHAGDEAQMLMLDMNGGRWEDGAVIKPGSPRRHVRAIVLFAVLAAAVGAAAAAQQSAQTAASARAKHKHGSLGEELTALNGREVHILYIHGIGSNGPGERSSLDLRRSICRYLGRCANGAAGEQVGNYDYVDQDQFALDAPPPPLHYMGQPVWRTPEEWRASAPFAVHYKLISVRGPAVWVDELNWWPLVFSLKCRQIVERDTELSGPDTQRIKICSTRETDDAVKGRFLSYDWLSEEEAQKLLELPRRGALINRILKHNTSNWQIPDAVMALGPLNDALVDGIRQLILRSVVTPGSSILSAPGASPIMPAPNEEFVIVTQSLASYLVFSALDIDPAVTQTPLVLQSAGAFTQVLRQTSLVYFFANQVPLFELANLENSPTDRFVAHLELWGKVHCEYEQEQWPGMPCRLPKIVALNDPSDLLTWTVPKLGSVDVHNYRVRNAFRWFWLVEDPMKAHVNYARDRRAIGEMLNPTKDLESDP